MKCHGFDVGKFVASSLFYAPCQAKLPNDSFFNDYSGDMREPLNPYQMVRNDIRPVQIWENRIEKRSQGGARSTPNANASPTADHSLVDAALMKWRNTPKGHGNKSFFDLAVGLRRAGLSLQEIRPHLCREACTARSPHDRKADINGIMKSISRPIYSSGPTRSQGKLKTCVAPYVTC